MYNICMVSADYTFQWDPEKAKRNLVKHGISFEEAKGCFFDSNARLIDDPQHSAEEKRYVLLGLSFKGNLLIVCHCYRNEDRAIRIISARNATTKEQDSYWRFYYAK